MAYIRTTKATFFTSDDIVSLSLLARLLYIALWTEADRDGRLTWRPGNFKLRFLPGDACDINELCSELLNSGLVVIYPVDGKTYAEIPSFTRHQVINSRERKSTLPARVIYATSTRGDPDMLAQLIRLTHPDKHGNSRASNEATVWLLAQRQKR